MCHLVHTIQTTQKILYQKTTTTNTLILKNTTERLKDFGDVWPISKKCQSQ